MININQMGIFEAPTGLNMTPVATAKTPQSAEQARLTVKGTQPSSESRYGTHPSFGSNLVRQIRIPKFASLKDEREFEKLHHAAALRWLGAQAITTGAQAITLQSAIRSSLIISGSTRTGNHSLI